MTDRENDEETDSPMLEVGRTTFFYPSGPMYEGEYMIVDGNPVRHGTGNYVDEKESYVGQWRHDAMHGEGQMFFGSKATYRGSFAANKFDGFGTYSWDDGALYEGNWKENKMHGRGRYTDSEKSCWEGDFFNGLFDNGRSMISLR